MTILAVGLVAVYQSQSQSVSLSANTRFLTTASLLAQARMAGVEALSPRALVSGSGDFGEDFPDYRWQLEVADVPELPAVKRVVLTVSHARLARDGTYRLILYKVVSQ